MIDKIECKRDRERQNLHTVCPISLELGINQSWRREGDSNWTKKPSCCPCFHFLDPWPFQTCKRVFWYWLSTTHSISRLHKPFFPRQLNKLSHSMEYRYGHIRYSFLIRVMAYQLKQVHNRLINLSTVITLGTISHILNRDSKLHCTASNHYLGFWLSMSNYQPLIVLVGEGIFQTFRNTRTQICGVTSNKL